MGQFSLGQLGVSLRFVRPGDSFLLIFRVEAAQKKKKKKKEREREERKNEKKKRKRSLKGAVMAGMMSQKLYTSVHRMLG